MDFTVIVPTFERPEELRGCLEALGGLDYPRDLYEVLVVDDGGRMALGFAEGMEGVRVLRRENGGPGAARNLGARHAKGRWLAFTDDDCRPEGGWLWGLRGALEEGEEVLCGGRTANLLTENVCAVTSQLIADAAYRYFNGDRQRGRFLASNNLGVWRTAFLAAGGFDERFRVASEDRELVARWADRYGRVVWAEGATVYHRHDLTVGAFMRQHYQYGQGAAQYLAARREAGGGITDDFGFRMRMGELVLRPALMSGRPMGVLAMLVLWQVANTVGFLRGSVRG